MLRIRVQLGYSHLLPSADVFSDFVIVTPYSQSAKLKTVCSCPMFSRRNKKDPAMRSLSPIKIIGRLFGRNVCRTGAFFTLADHVLDCLSFFQTRVAACLNFRVMNKQVRSAVVGYDKTKTFRIIEPFYFSRTHYNTPWPSVWPSICNIPLTFVREDILERRKDMLYKPSIIPDFPPAPNKNNKKLFKIPKNISSDPKNSVICSY